MNLALYFVTVEHGNLAALPERLGRVAARFVAASIEAGDKPDGLRPAGRPAIVGFGAPRDPGELAPEPAAVATRSTTFFNTALSRWGGSFSERPASAARDRHASQRVPAVQGDEHPLDERVDARRDLVIPRDVGTR